MGTESTLLSYRESKLMPFERWRLNMTSSYGPSTTGEGLEKFRSNLKFVSKLSMSSRS